MYRSERPVQGCANIATTAPVGSEVTCSGALRLALVAAGTVLCLADLVLVEDLRFLGGVGTDPNSMVPTSLLSGAGYLAITRALSTANPGTGDTGGPLPGALPAQEVVKAIPSEVAMAPASARVLAPSLRRMASTWWSTVRTETTSRSAICPFCKPLFTNASTSSSRAVSPYRFCASTDEGHAARTAHPVPVAVGPRSPQQDGVKCLQLLQGAAKRLLTVGVGQRERGLVGATELEPKCPCRLPAPCELEAVWRTGCYRLLGARTPARLPP